jgi:type II secretory pathway component PulF
MSTDSFPVGASRTPRHRGLFNHVSRSAQGELLEALALLASAGIDAASALDSIISSTKTKVLSRRLKAALETVQGGYPLWYALQEHGILPSQRVWLIRIGEESGRLAEHLQSAVDQHRKEQMFRARVESAMLYPVIIAVVALVAGISVSWFILPRLTTVFSNLQVDLPLMTRWLLVAGEFLGTWGYIAVPSAIAVLVAVFAILFVVPGTKRAGEFLLLHTPGVGGLIRDGELAKFGHVFGSLLHVGVPVPEALGALSTAAGTTTFRRFYEQLREHIVKGESFGQAFDGNPFLARTMPQTIQQLLTTAEQSGQLAETVGRLGDIYEGRMDLATKNLTVILEPILLFAVWLGVVLLAVSIITPIYSVLQGVSR